MANRRINARRLSRHLSYTIEEAAECVGAHKNTVRNWIKAGLAVTDGQRPALISGEALVCFLKERKSRTKQPLRVAEFYCFKCRIATPPDGYLADFVATSPSLGTLAGICPRCGTLVYRRVSRATLAIVSANLDLQILPGSETHKRDAEPQAQL